jgi:DNA polymerase-3 subunit chi
MQRVDFYVLGSNEPRARLKFACRLAEKAYLDGRRTLVWLDAPELAGFDDLLWTFADRSFVPHEPFDDAQQWSQTPVLLSCERAPEQEFELLLNLAAEVPPSSQRAQQVIEIIDADPARREAGRARFRHYRAQGVQPQTRSVEADAVL